MAAGGLGARRPQSGDLGVTPPRLSLSAHVDFQSRVSLLVGNIEPEPQFYGISVEL